MDAEIRKTRALVSTKKAFLENWVDMFGVPCDSIVQFI